MTPELFQELAQKGYNRIPLVCELLADLDTPLSSYLKLADGPYSFLLESIQGGETWGRYSIIGLPCNTVLRITGNNVEIEHKKDVIEQFDCDEPMAFVDEFRQRYSVPELDSLPMFDGGLVGYFAYDTVRYTEKRLARADSKPDNLKTPDILLMLAEEVLVFDNLSGTLKIIVHCDPSITNAYDIGRQRLNELSSKIRTADISPKDLVLSDSEKVAPPTGIAKNFKAEFSSADYKAAVNTIKDYILDGDCMQVVLSQRLSSPYHSEPIDLYRALRLLNPSPYMYFLNLNGFHIVGSSPEILARSEAGRVTVRPIAGTRPRGMTTEQDLALEKDLLADPKELAEHLMLIDLGRNDVGRIAETGSVVLEENMQVERYSHVMHIVSKVSGKLLKGLSALDVLKACLPAGTLSGAPKVRAMEIIDELEPSRRGVYGGAVGYVSWQGELDTAIAIRTAIIKDQTLYVQAGAGIVADSQPDAEWQECMNKAQAIFKAAALAEQTDALNNESNKSNDTSEN